jgi:hypothetical protein
MLAVGDPTKIRRVEMRKHKPDQRDRVRFLTPLVA